MHCCQYLWKQISDYRLAGFEPLMLFHHNIVKVCGMDILIYNFIIVIIYNNLTQIDLFMILQIQTIQSTIQDQLQK